MTSTDPGRSGGRLTARLAARTAHELNNIAAVISGHVYLLRAAAEPPEEGFDAMEKALEHVQRLTASLTALGGLGADEPESVDVAEVAREAAGGGAIVLDLPEGLPRVRAGRRDLLRAISALLTNAREAEAGEVRLSARAADSSVIVAVEDTGPGISAEVRRRDFDPLFTTRGEKGRGIGLSVARLAAGLSGGSLSLEDLPGGGTRATITLPAETSAAES